MFVASSQRTRPSPHTQPAAHSQPAPAARAHTQQRALWHRVSRMPRPHFPPTTSPPRAASECVGLKKLVMFLSALTGGTCPPIRVGFRTCLIVSRTRHARPAPHLSSARPPTATRTRARSCAQPLLRAPASARAPEKKAKRGANGSRARACVPEWPERGPWNVAHIASGGRGDAARGRAGKARGRGLQKYAGGGGGGGASSERAGERARARARWHGMRPDLSRALAGRSVLAVRHTQGHARPGRPLARLL